MRALRFSRDGVLPGFGAGLLAAVVMLLLGRLWNTPVPPQLLSDRLTAVIPVSVFDAVLGQLESAAKPLLFVGLLVGQVALAGLIGAVVVPLVRRGVSVLGVFLGLAAAIWLSLALVLAPLGGIGLLGSRAPAGETRTLVAFAVIAVCFAAALSVWALGTLEAESFDPARRRLLSWLGLGVPAGLAVVYLGRFFVDLSGKSRLHAQQLSDNGLYPVITPAGDFYEVSKNFENPSVAAAGWKLSIEGLVNTPRSYTYDELLARPSQTHIATLECISNEIGEGYIGNGQWTGFPLKTLLDEAGIKSTAIKAVFYAADNYSDSVPVAVATDPNTFLVYQLDGQPLAKDHGFPMRLLVPNIYGMKNVKWITRIAFVDTDYQGYWQHQGWSDTAIIQTMSRIDTPRANSTVPSGQSTLIGGIAFAGSRGITKVQVSTDGAKTWNDAQLEAPLSSLSWVRWTYHWTPTAQGRVTLAVRAADGSGTFQTAEVADPAPDGATGYHKIAVRVGAPDATGAAQTPESVEVVGTPDGRDWNFSP